MIWPIPVAWTLEADGTIRRRAIGYRHHVAFAVGRNANVIREALVKYLGYEIDLK